MVAIYHPPPVDMNGYIDIPEGALAYRYEGPDGTGDTVVLLHGVPTSSYLWRNVLPPLSERFSVFAPDLLGYGSSAKGRCDLSPAAQALYVLRFLDRLGIERAHFVGHNVGGAVVQLMALSYPDVVNKMALVDTAAYDARPLATDTCACQDADDLIIANIDVVKAFRRVFERGTTRSTPEQVCELARVYASAYAGEDGRQAFARAAEALKASDLSGASDEIEALPNETLVVWGAEDTLLPAALGRRLAAAMPAATFIELPGAGHFTPEDAPQDLGACLASFFGS